MSFMNAFNMVLYYLLNIANIVLIPVSAMIGFTIGGDFIARFNFTPDIAALLSVASAFVAVGLINGLIAVQALGVAPSAKRKQSKAMSNALSKDAKVEQNGTKKASTRKKSKA